MKIEFVSPYLKQCKACKQWKEDIYFTKQPGMLDGRQNKCKPCKNLKQRNSVYYKAKYVGYDNAKAKKNRLNQQLITQYGEDVADLLINSIESIDVMKELQGY